MAVLYTPCRLPIMWLKVKRNKERYDIDNYVGGISKQVEVVSYHHHPMEMEANPTEQNEQQDEDISNCEEHYYERIMGEGSNVESDESGVFQPHQPLYSD